MICLTPFDKKWKKNINFFNVKVLWTGLKICTYRFLGMPTLEMHYVRTLCDNCTFWVMMVFLDFLTGRFRHRVLKHGVGSRMGCKEDCCIGPIPFWWILTPFYATCLLKFWFFRNHLSYRLETSAIGFSMPQTLNMHHSSHFQCIFPSQNQQNVKFLPEIVIFHEPLIV